MHTGIVLCSSKPSVVPTVSSFVGTPHLPRYSMWHMPGYSVWCYHSGGAGW